MIGRCLAMPPREPDYRQARPHDAFVANLPLDAAAASVRIANRLGGLRALFRLAPGGHATARRGKVFATRVERAALRLPSHVLSPPADNSS